MSLVQLLDSSSLASIYLNVEDMTSRATKPFVKFSCLLWVVSSIVNCCVPALEIHDVYNLDACQPTPRVGSIDQTIVHISFALLPLQRGSHFAR